MPEIKIAKLKPEALSKVQALEKELGTYIVALEPQLPYAQLTAEQLDLVAALEQELGLLLLAYKKQ